MKYISLNENTKISKVTFGCMRIKDSKICEKELLSTIEQCIELGIDSFDHAPVYGGYTCQKIFGDSILRKKPEIRKKIKLITKTGIKLPKKEENSIIYYDSRKASILKEVDQTLREFGTDYIDLLLIHRPDPLADPAETADALDEIIKMGKALSIGVSNYMPYQTDVLQSKLKNKLSTNQVELSVKSVDNFFNGTVDNAFKTNMSLMAWSPLGGGSIFKNTDVQSNRLKTVLGEIAKERNLDLDTIMYAWLFSHPSKIAAITGTMNMNRIKNAIKALEIKLTYDEWYKILAASRGYNVP